MDVLLNTCSFGPSRISKHSTLLVSSLFFFLENSIPSPPIQYLYPSSRTEIHPTNPQFVVLLLLFLLFSLVTSLTNTLFVDKRKREKANEAVCSIMQSLEIEFDILPVVSILSFCC